MTQQRFGIWFLGAWGGVSTTTAVGLATLQQGMSNSVGLVSALPKFEKLNLADWEQFAIGGHEIRETSYYEEAMVLAKKSRVFDESMLEKISPQLGEFDANVRPGCLINVGDRIRSFASSTTASHDAESVSVAIERISADLKEFQTRNDLAHVIVVNLASTEPSPDSSLKLETLAELEAQIQTENSDLPASTIYAYAAMKSGCSHINFTPSAGSNFPAFDELSKECKVLHTGRDGKTGETLLKSVLAPMFAERNLNVMSWVGHNIFGNMDGKVLDDPVNKASKVQSKDHLLGNILGYKPQSLVTIEYIESLGDWKTAWDHIHFQGFLNTPMTLQFTWQGCDSLLAAPLVLDLVRFTEREHRRGNSGLIKHLASFFKSPMGKDIPPAFANQIRLLDSWAIEVAIED